MMHGLTRGTLGWIKTYEVLPLHLIGYLAKYIIQTLKNFKIRRSEARNITVFTVADYYGNVYQRCIDADDLLGLFLSELDGSAGKVQH